MTTDKNGPATAEPTDAMDIEKTDADQATPSPVHENLRNIVKVIEKCVKTKDTRLLMSRLLRQTAVVRKQLSSEVLSQFIQQSLPSAPSTPYLLSQLQAGSSMDTDQTPSTISAVLPEVEMYAVLLLLIYLIDKNDFSTAKDVSNHALQRLRAFNRRTLDVIAARIYYYYSWSYECTDSLQDVRSILLGLHSTAVLRHDIIGQETLLNLLLRNYLHYNLYDQAEKFRSKAQKPDQFRSNQEFCRYLYYMGRIRAIQLEYTDAKEYLQQANRKAPTMAYGFRITAAKWLVLVRLLLGEIPERSEFAVPGMKQAMQPYLELTLAVRNGDVEGFNRVVDAHSSVFRADKTHNLITRLHHNVIRIGLRRINLAYSRISLKEVAGKLRLSSVEDAEHIVAKAIRDGGIEATINHAEGYMQSSEVVDVYSTTEPQAAFHARIAFCLDIHNEAVKAMRFEPDAHKKDLESADARKERLTQEQEIAKAAADDEDEF